MNTKGFMILLIGVLIVAGAIGGAFFGGMALGKDKGKEEAAAETMPSRWLASATPRAQTGEPSQQQLNQFRRSFSGTPGPTGSGQFNPGTIRQGMGGLSGTIEKIEGDTITVNTPQGNMTAKISDDTPIQKLVEGTTGDLQTGVRVTITGQRDDDGNVIATSINLTPEGLGGFFGGGFFGGQQPPRLEATATPP